MDRVTPKTEKELAVELTQSYIHDWMANTPSKPSADEVTAVLKKIYATLKSLD